MSAQVTITFSSTLLGQTVNVNYPLTDQQASNILATVRGIIDAGRQNAARLNIAQGGGTFTPSTNGDAINYIAAVAFQAVRNAVVPTMQQAAAQQASAGVPDISPTPNVT